MSFHAVKFQIKILDKIVPTDKRIDELRHWAKIFNDNNLTPIVENNISCGNLSFRVSPKEDIFIITASQMGYNKELPANGFVSVLDCDFEKRIISIVGEREPSSESMLHYAIYKARPDVNVIFHGHSEEILKNSKKLKLTETAQEQPFGTVELANSVLNILGNNNFVVMKNHGFVSVAKSFDEAGNNALAILKEIYSPSNSSNANVL